MMDSSPNPARTALREIVSWDSGPVVSIFLPQDPARTDLDPIQLKACAQWVQESLVRDHHESTETAERLARPLLDAAGVPPTPGHGRAWFLREGYAISLALTGCRNLVMEIGGVPDTLRLLPHVFNGPDYVVLAISQNHPRAFRANRSTITPLEIANLPKSLSDALWYVRREPTLERHGSGAAHMGGGGQQYRKDDIHQFLHLVDKALCTALAGSHSPLVVMGVGYEAAMFINESHYRHVVRTPVTGNPDAVDLDTIHRLSLSVLGTQPGPADAALARARELAGTGLAISDAAEILEAAHRGAVDQLLVARSLTGDDAYRGPLEPRREQLATALNRAMDCGATAHVVSDEELPPGAVATALLRY